MSARLPDFLVVGAPKSGTTSLFHYLRQHPEIFLPVRKELHYFSYEAIAANAAGPRDEVVLPSLCADRESYLEHYRGAAGHAAVGEISPSYLYYHDVRSRIAAELGQVKIVAMLRDPRHKAFSQYMHLVRDGRETLSFADGLDAEDERRRRGWSDLWRYVESSRYAIPVERYLETFGRERVRVYAFESFVADPSATLRDLFGFLGVDPGFRCDTSGVYNRTGRSRLRWLADLLSAPHPAKSVAKAIVPERARVALRERLMRWNTGDKPQMDPQTLERLTRNFDADVRRLERTLDRELPWLERAAALATGATG